MNYLNYFQFVSQRKKSFIITLIALTLLFLYSASGIKLNEDILDLLPLQDPVVKNHKTLLTEFNKMDILFVDIGPQTEDIAVTPEELIQASDSLAQEMEESALFTEISHTWDMDDFSIVMDILREHRASLFTDFEMESVQQKITPDAIRETLQGWKRTLIENPAPMLSNIFANDPLALDTGLIKKLNALRSMGAPVKVEKGRLFSDDMRHLLILASPKYPGTDGKRAEELVAFMNTALQKVGETLPPGKIHIAYLSGHRFGVDNATMIKGDIKLTITLSVTAIALLSFLVFSRISLIPLTLAPALFGGAFAAGIIPLITPEISAISIGCGSMLVGIAVDYGIHLLYHLDQASSKGQDKLLPAPMIQKLSTPILLGAATTITAFLTLLLSILPGYRQLGLFTAVGIGGAVFFALYALPFLIPPKTAHQRGPLLSLSKIFPPFFQWSIEKRGMLLFCTLLLSLFSFSGLFRLGFEGDIQKLNAASPETKRDLRIVEEHFKETMSSTSIAVHGKNIEEALAQNDKLFIVLMRFTEKGVILSNNSLHPLLPSQQQQQKNHDRWKRFWTKQRVEKLIEDTERAASKLGMRPEALSKPLRLLPGDTPLLSQEKLKRGFLKKVFESQIAVTENGALILTKVKLKQFEELQLVQEAITKEIPDVIITNGRHFAEHMVSLIYSELKRLGTTAILAIGILLAFCIRKKGSFFKIMAPLFLSLLWTFGIMGWIGMKINMMNCIVVVFIFGLVVDYSIFLQTAWANSSGTKDKNLAITGGAITISALTTLFGLGSLLFARHPALHTIGATALLGIGIGLLAVLMIVPLFGKDGQVGSDESAVVRKRKQF